MKVQFWSLGEWSSEKSIRSQSASDARDTISWYKANFTYKYFVIILQACFTFKMLLCLCAAVSLINQREIVTRTTSILINLVHQNLCTAAFAGLAQWLQRGDFTEGHTDTVISRSHESFAKPNKQELKVVSQ